MALAQSSEGRVVYTPAHTIITSGDTLPLDLNNDGTVDFTFINIVDTFEGSTEGFLRLRPAQGENQPRGNNIYKRAAALPTRSPVWFKAVFVSGSSDTMISANATHRCSGPWNNVTNRYLGLKFKINSQTHFGWARLSASCNSHNQITALLTGYAYETVANRPILTGEAKGPDVVNVEPDDVSVVPRVPQAATLGMLASGAHGLSIWRREEHVGL